MCFKKNPQRIEDREVLQEHKKKQKSLKQCKSVFALTRISPCLPV